MTPLPAVVGFWSASNGGLVLQSTGGAKRGPFERKQVPIISPAKRDQISSYSLLILSPFQDHASNYYDLFRNMMFFEASQVAEG